MSVKEDVNDGEIIGLKKMKWGRSEPPVAGGGWRVMAVGGIIETDVFSTCLATGVPIDIPLLIPMAVVNISDAFMTFMKCSGEIGWKLPSIQFWMAANHAVESTLASSPASQSPGDFSFPKSTCKSSLQVDLQVAIQAPIRFAFSAVIQDGGFYQLRQVRQNRIIVFIFFFNTEIRAFFKWLFSELFPKFFFYCCCCWIFLIILAINLIRWVTNSCDFSDGFENKPALIFRGVFVSLMASGVWGRIQCCQMDF